MATKKGKTGKAGVLKKAERDVAVKQIHNTIESIQDSNCRNELKTEEGTHPFFLLKSKDDLQDLGGMGGDLVVGESLAELLFERLATQGYVIYFDENKAKQMWEDAKARLATLLP